MNNNQAVRYLESPEYEHVHRPQPIRDGLIGLKEDRTITARDIRGLGPYLRRAFGNKFSLDVAEGHADRFCNFHEELCTGEGFRWKPGDPVARFP